MPITTSLDRITAEVTRLRVLFVNVYFVRGDDGWVLIDAALLGSAGAIVEAAESLFGHGTAPRAILLTHGHFDHVGALSRLLERGSCRSSPTRPGCRT